MIDPRAIFGRLGNSMFQYAALYAFCRDAGYPIYLQDEKYFAGYEDEIRKLYSDDIPPLTNAVAIHVRRGDYVNNPMYVDLMETDYYKKAMAMFPNEKFVVFSDNPIWCEEQDIFKGCEFSYRTEIEDLNRMASCKHQIIANSSLSWWAAWLNPNPDKIVVSPKHWFANPEDEKFIGIPNSWKRI